MSNTPSLHMKDLSVGYAEKTLLSDIQLKAMPGELIAVIGRNGTGKTTLIKTLAGLQKAQKGKIFLQEKEIQELSPKQRAQRIGLVLTNRHALPAYDVLTLLHAAHFPYDSAFSIGNKPNEENRQYLDMCGIGHLADKLLNEISDGELQKVMVAKVLAQQTPLIIMDEPTAFLDYVAKEELLVMLKHLVRNKNLCIIFSSHDIELVEKFADKKWLVADGKVNESF